jgi:hypothetical protein
MPDQNSISLLAISYLGLLVLFAIFAELILYSGFPIIQNEWKQEKLQKPLTIETFEMFHLSKKDLLLYHLDHKITAICNIPSEFVSLLKLKIGDFMRWKRSH